MYYLTIIVQQKNKKEKCNNYMIFKKKKNGMDFSVKLNDQSISKWNPPPQKKKNTLVLFKKMKFEYQLVLLILQL